MRCFIITVKFQGTLRSSTVNYTYPPQEPSRSPGKNLPKACFASSESGWFGCFAPRLLHIKRHLCERVAPLPKVPKVSRQAFCVQLQHPLFNLFFRIWDTLYGVRSRYSLTVSVQGQGTRPRRRYRCECSLPHLLGRHVTFLSLEPWEKCLQGFVPSPVSPYEYVY
jgi:hypothetical protein